MNANVTSKWLTAVFFCTMGWVCIAPANGAGPGTDNNGPNDNPTPVPAGGASVIVAPGALGAPGTPQSAPGNTPGAPGGTPGVKVGALGQIDLHVKDLDLVKVLQLLSIQSQRNIIAAKDVNGAVSADLYGVNFYEALDAVLQPNGYGYHEKGNFIYVYSAAELQKIADAEKKTTIAVIRLNYLSAADASTFATPLLSSAGAIALPGAVGDGFQPSISDGGANKYAHADALIVRDWPENLDQIKALMRELDTRPRQALIEGTVLEARLDEDNGMGVDLSIVANFGLSGFTNPLASVGELLSGAVGGNGTAINTQTTSGDFRSKSSFKIGVVDKNIAAFVHALDQVTDTVVLANPKLLVLNRQRAQILVGDRIAYLSTQVTQTSSTQSVEYLDTGTQLDVRPFISDDGYIRLELKPSISTGKLRDIGQITVPDESTEELTTNVMVKNGQTVVLGGLFKETTVVGRTQVPGLGDLPLLGLPFKGKTDQTIRTEVIFLVTTTVMSEDGLTAGGQRAKDTGELLRNAARESLLPWARTKTSSLHLRRSRESLAKGDKEGALREVNLALRHDPGYQEAQRLKEEITGKRVNWPDHSMFRDVVDQMMNQQRPRADATTRPSDDASAEVRIESSVVAAPIIDAPQAEPTRIEETQTQSPEAQNPAANNESPAPTPVPEAVVIPASDRE